MYKYATIAVVASAHQFETLEKHARDLPTCISELEALIPNVEKVIDDIKNGDYTQALSDGEAMLPDLEKAFTDCTSKELKFEEVFKRVGEVNLKHFGV